jgi:uncharacterized protein YjgD (DUF1641 family)
MNTAEQLLERLTRIEAKLEGVDRLEKQVEVFTRTWENFHDLSRDMSLLLDPAVQSLTDELVEVETGFQLEDIFGLLKNLLPRLRYISYSLEQLENIIDCWRDLEPVLKIAVPHFIDYLDHLDQKGVFRINRAVLEMYAKLAEHYTPEDIDTIGDGFVRMHGLVMKFSDPVVIQFFENILKMYAKLAEHYTPEDIDAIGDGFVRMHGIIKKFSEPEFIRFIEKFMDLPAHMKLAEAKPTGPVGLMFRLMNQECRQGLGVALEMTRAMGKLQNGNGQPAEKEEG